METEKLVPVGGRMNFPPAEIILLESDINYTRLHFSDGSVILTSTNLGKLEPRFEKHSFFRINRQIMVNLQFVMYITDSTRLTLSNEMEVVLSRRKKNLFFKTFNSNF
jgi:DNA-binding LytR/AlgR family response regulator